MIKFHPTDAQLVSFSTGGLSPAESVLTSAHCDMCDECLNKVNALTQSAASEVFDDNKEHNTAIERDFISMFEAITNVDHKSAIYEPEGAPSDTEIEIEGKRFLLPPTLARFSDRLGEWSHLVGNLWQAQVDIGGGYLAQFIYMEKGGGVPEHTHKGSELTLVIDGEFVDGIDRYNNGDFLSFNSEQTHEPVANADKGCLVFSIIDQPLYFTSGWAKLINPLSSLFFKVNAHR